MDKEFMDDTEIQTLNQQDIQARKNRDQQIAEAHRLAEITRHYNADNLIFQTNLARSIFRGAVERPTYSMSSKDLVVDLGKRDEEECMEDSTSLLSKSSDMFHLRNRFHARYANGGLSYNFEQNPASSLHVEEVMKPKLPTHTHISGFISSNIRSRVAQALRRKEELESKPITADTFDITVSDEVIAVNLDDATMLDQHKSTGDDALDDDIDDIFGEMGDTTNQPNAWLKNDDDAFADLFPSFGHDVDIKTLKKQVDALPMVKGNATHNDSDDEEESASYQTEMMKTVGKRLNMDLTVDEQQIKRAKILGKR